MQRGVGLIGILAIIIFAVIIFFLKKKKLPKPVSYSQLGFTKASKNTYIGKYKGKNIEVKELQDRTIARIAVKLPVFSMFRLSENAPGILQMSLHGNMPLTDVFFPNVVHSKVHYYVKSKDPRAGKMFSGQLRSYLLKHPCSYNVDSDGKYLLLTKRKEDDLTQFLDELVNLTSRILVA